MARYDIDKVKSYARSRWAEILSRVAGIDADLLDGEHHHCPKCGGTDRFRFTNADGDGSLLCNQCARTGIGDGLAAVEWATGRKFADALATVAEYLGIPPEPPIANGSSHSSHTSHANGKKKADAADPAEHLQFLPWDESAESLASIWTIHKQPITLAAIRAVGGRVARYRKQYIVLALPVWGEQLDAAAPVGWCLYNITGGTLPKFRVDPKNPSGKRSVEWVKVKLTHGSKKGIIADLSRLRSAHQTDVSQSAAKSASRWKVEGPSDLLALLSLPDLPADVAALTNANGAGERPEPWMLALFAGRPAVVVHDSDTPGQNGAIGWTDERGKHRPGWAPLIAGQASECRNVLLLYPIQKDHGKDLRDFLRDGEGEGKRFADLLDLAEKAAPVEAAEISKASLSQAATATASNGTAELIEAADDPHRLARVNLANFATCRDGATIRYWREEWYTWKPSRGCYRPMKESELRAKVTTSIRKEFERLWHEEDMPKYEAWVKSDKYDPGADKGPPVIRKVTPYIITTVLNAMASMTLLSSSVELGTMVTAEKREQRRCVAMQNGILDLDALFAGKDDCIFSHTPNWFSTVCLSYSFPEKFDIQALCPRFLTVLYENQENDQQRINILQEWAGYLLSGSTDQQKFLMLEGEGANGKSVFLAAMEAMIGVDNCTHLSLESFDDKYAWVGTVGKLANISSESSDVEGVAENALKAFTSGDRQTFQRKYLSSLEAYPTARLMVSANARPRFADKTGALWRRMLLVPWRIRVPEHKRIYGMDKASWWEASGELPGILLWALQGLDRLRRQTKFSTAQVCNEAMRDYQREMNPTKLFVEQHLVELPTGTDFIASKPLYDFYREWAFENGYRPVSDQNFFTELKRAFPSIKKIRRRGSGDDWNKRFYAYEGIRYGNRDDDQDNEIESSRADLLFS